MNSAATIDGTPVRMSTMNDRPGEPAPAVLDEVDARSSYRSAPRSAARRRLDERADGSRGTAPPPSRRAVMPFWELVHHLGVEQQAAPLLTTVQRIQTSGTSASRKAAHITTWRTVLDSARPRRPRAARSAACGVGAGRVGRRSSGAHSVNAFLRSMTMRATALTTKVRTKSTSPAAMNAPVLAGVSNSPALLAILEAKVSPPLNSDQVKPAGGVRDG